MPLRENEILFVYFVISVLIDEIHEHTHKTERKVRAQAVRAAEYRRKDSCKCTCGKLSFLLRAKPLILSLHVMPPEFYIMVGGHILTTPNTTSPFLRKGG